MVHVPECFCAFYVTRSYIYPIYDCARVLSCFLCNAVMYISYMTVLECFCAFYVTRSYTWSCLLYYVLARQTMSQMLFYNGNLEHRSLFNVNKHLNKRHGVP